MMKRDEPLEVDGYRREVQVVNHGTALVGGCLPIKTPEGTCWKLWDWRIEQGTVYAVWVRSQWDVDMQDY